MRITNSMVSHSLIKNLNANLQKMNKYQTQLLMNTKITKLSDDPVGAAISLQTRSSLQRTEQYKKNAEDARTLLAFTETALMDISDYLSRAYELTVFASNDTNNVTDKDDIALEIKQIMEHCIDTLNSTCKGQYLFGGKNISKAPFTYTGGEILYNGVNILSGDPSVLAAFKNETVVYRLGKDLDMDVSVNGLKAIGYGPDNILSMLSDVENALKNDLPVREFVGKLNNAKEHITSLVSEIGGKYNRLEDLISRYEDDWYNYKEIQASIEGIDEAEVITQLKLQEAVYRTALAVGAGAIQPSLLDFLK